MCYSVLEEITKVRECEASRNRKLPRPYYLFVQKYGRSMETEMPSIAKFLGNGRWFLFSTEGKKKDISMTSRFLVEQEKHAEIGKSFHGCVLVELTGEEEPKELFEFLNYIKQKTQQFCCVFSTRALEHAEEIKERLEQHFFVRRIDGRRYGEKEQGELFLKVLSGYGFAVGNLEEAVERLFSEVLWQEEDMVQSRIENLAQNLAYEKMMLAEAALEVSLEEVKKAAEGLKRVPEIRCIGFAIGE